MTTSLGALVMSRRLRAVDAPRCVWQASRESGMGRGYGASMKLTVSEADGSTDVWVFITEGEAEGIARALRARLDGEAGYRGPGYHLHLEDGEGSEFTIAVLDAE